MDVRVVRRLRPLAVRLALRLCVSFSCKTGQCDPGYPKLAEDMAVSKRSVSRAIDELETAGWVSVDRTGGDNTRNAQINLLIPAVGEPRSGDNMLSSENEPIVATSDDNMLSSENRSLQVTENAPSGDRNEGVQVTNRVATQITCEPVNL
jgi:DNA-binding transcriptional regulator YhcF (GntR family)